MIPTHHDHGERRKAARAALDALDSAALPPADPTDPTARHIHDGETFGAVFHHHAKRARLKGVRLNFTPETDSNGEPWKKQLRVALEPDISLGQVLRTAAKGDSSAGIQPAINAFLRGDVLYAQNAGTSSALAGGPGFRETESGMEVWDLTGSRSFYSDFTTGDLHINGNAVIEGFISVGGDVLVDGTVHIHGDPSLLIDGTTTMSGDLTIDADLEVTGTTTLGGTLSLDADLDAAGYRITGAEIEGSSFRTTGAPGITIEDDTITFASGGTITYGAISIKYGAGAHTFDGDVSVNDDFAVFGGFAHLDCDVRLGASGDKVGFYGSSGRTKPTVAGSDPLAIVKQLVARLAEQGLITDGTT